MQLRKYNIIPHSNCHLSSIMSKGKNRLFWMALAPETCYTKRFNVFYRTCSSRLCRISLCRMC